MNYKLISLFIFILGCDVTRQILFKLGAKSGERPNEAKNNPPSTIEREENHQDGLSVAEEEPSSCEIPPKHADDGFVNSENNLTSPENKYKTVEGTLHSLRILLAKHMLDVFSSLYNWIGMGICCVEIILWLLILEMAPLNVAYPIMSFDFCLVLLASKLILNEEISLQRMVGAILITIGVILVGLV
ncbi:MAG: hypothetical protein HQM08_07865 [Candidatus Riflebacteria bacterium]|nr:hypothetical protein [Candidatus Riflebacteria bacterium]